MVRWHAMGDPPASLDGETLQRSPDRLEPCWPGISAPDRRRRRAVLRAAPPTLEPQARDVTQQREARVELIEASDALPAGRRAWRR